MYFCRSQNKWCKAFTAVLSDTISAAPPQDSARRWKAALLSCPVTLGKPHFPLTKHSTRDTVREKKLYITTVALELSDRNWERYISNDNLFPPPSLSFTCHTSSRIHRKARAAKISPHMRHSQHQKHQLQVSGAIPLRMSIHLWQSQLQWRLSSLAICITSRPVKTQKQQKRTTSSAATYSLMN